MQKIEMTLPEIASFMDKISVFVPDECKNIDELVEKAFSFDHIPDLEFLEITSSATTIEDAIDEYWLPGLSVSHKDKAAIRRMLELVGDKNDLLLVAMEIFIDIDTESFEFSLFLRKASEIL